MLRGKVVRVRLELEILRYHLSVLYLDPPIPTLRMAQG
jgi:hypothetical protein